MIITRKAEFSASHRCYLPDRPAEENERIYGEEAHPNGHGHNFVIEVSLEGEPDPETGMIYDLKTLKDLIQEKVVEPFDHRHLNHEVPAFAVKPPTAENLAIEIWNRLAPSLSRDGAQLIRVRVSEGPDLFIDYYGDRT